MNKHIKYIAILTILALSACKKDPAIFDKSADERRIERMGIYRNQLVGAENGWILHVASPISGATRQFWCKFIDKDNRVVVQDLTAYGSGLPGLNGEFKIGTSQYVSLIFDTGGPLGTASSVSTKDPNAGSPFAANNTDLIDFEFVFDQTKNDTITLKGVYSKSPAFMFKASATDKKKYFDDYYQFRRTIFGATGALGSPIKNYMEPWLRDLYMAFGLPTTPDDAYISSLTMKSGSNKYILFINPIKGSITIADDLGDGAFENPMVSGLYYTDVPSQGFRLITPLKLSNGIVLERITDFKRISTQFVSPVKTTAKVNNTIEAEISGEVEVASSYFNQLFPATIKNPF